jgi:hypothetical protein
MRAIYKNEEFLSAILYDLNLISIVTYEERSEEEGFEEKRDYYVKIIKIEDEDLEELRKVSFYVRYKDSVEENEMWIVDEGRAVGLIPDIENGIVVIDVPNSPKDDTWIQYERGASAKQISLKDCTEYIIKTVYSKKDGKVVDKLEETISVSEEEFKKAMLKYRK